jgi:hypothetical protein
MRGQSFVQPDGPTIGALAGWATVTVLSSWLAVASRARAGNHAAPYLRGVS